MRLSCQYDKITFEKHRQLFIHLYVNFSFRIPRANQLIRNFCNILSLIFMPCCKVLRLGGLQNNSAGKFAAKIRTESIAMLYSDRKSSRLLTKILPWDQPRICYFDSLKNCRQIVSRLWSVFRAFSPLLYLYVCLSICRTSCPPSRILV